MTASRREIQGCAVRGELEKDMGTKDMGTAGGIQLSDSAIR